jgi:hypothetical protein
MDMVIPKTEIQVDIVQTDQKCEEFFLYLNNFSPWRNGPETLEEFLNSQQSFIPGKRCIDRSFQIVNRQNIIYAKEKSPVAEQTTVLIQVQLRNLETLNVSLYELLPTFSARPIDFLNSPPVFLPFIHEQTRIYINKNHILRAGIQ